MYTYKLHFSSQFNCHFSARILLRLLAGFHSLPPYLHLTHSLRLTKLTAAATMYHEDLRGNHCFLKIPVILDDHLLRASVG